jgi:hypothetical protein
MMFSLASRALTQSHKRFTPRLFHASSTALAKLNVEGLASKVDLDGQNVLMRVDLNVPLSKEVSFSFAWYIPLFKPHYFCISK